MGAKGSYLRRFDMEGGPRIFVNGVMPLYKSCKTAVSVEGELSNSFSVKVGVHQGSALS